jgi:hypothetical protein
MSTTSTNDDAIPVKNEAGEVIGSASRAQFMDSLTSGAPFPFEITDTVAIRQIRGDSNRSISAGYEIRDAPNS